MKGKATSFDIAHYAGVSQSTVSRALRNSPLVNEETRKRVHDIAKQLNYKVDKNASNLRTQQSSTLALLLFEDPTSDESQINPFFLSMLGSITRACAKEGYDLLVSFQSASADWQADYEDSHRADGIILLGYGDYTQYRERMEQLGRQGTHFARWGSVSSDSSGVTVGTDNVAAGRLAGEHLIAGGRSRIAFLGHADDHYPEFAGRYRGLVEALRGAGLGPDPALQFDALTTEEEGRSAAQALLDGGARFDAIFAASDLIAIGAMRALADAGLTVPEDVAVVGFDDIPAASLTTPPLTTVMQDIRGAGQALVETLLAQIEGRDLPPRKLPGTLVVRRSSGAA